MVTGANELRVRGKFKLPLKQFKLYYSLYIDVAGMKLISDHILFNESITIERIELEVINMNDQMMIDMCKAALNWLEA